MEFRCRVATASGQVMETTYVAESEERLRHELEEKGIFVLSVHGSGGALSFKLPQRRKIPAKDFTLFNQELATLLKAGLPLVQSLDILRKRIANPVFRGVLDDVYEKVRSGTALSEAFAAHGTLFSGVYTASLLAGEKSGSLEGVLRRYVHHTKIIAAVRARTISALIYPALLMLLAVGLVTGIVFKVVPQFADFFKQMGNGAELPFATQVLVAVSTTLVSQIWVILGVILTTIVIVGFWLRQPGSRRQLDAMLLKVPFVGVLATKFATAQVARTVATLLSGGIPLVNAVETSAKAIGNRAVAEELSDVARQVREGTGFGAALARKKTFPDVAIEMVEVGESTGALAEMLNSVADFYDEENETTLTRFAGLIEPVLLIVMGAVIAGLVLALYLPLFKLSSLAGG
ncbi:MAG: type II secretion system F family protein [Acidobacteria bacterium]|nr:MAG: type II secretion system F family protein [Acidobacteriota bacterium]